MSSNVLPPPPTTDVSNTSSGNASKQTKLTYRPILRVFQQNLEIFLCMMKLYEALTSDGLASYFADGTVHPYSDERQLVDEMYTEKLITDPMIRIRYHAGELSHKLREACGPSVPRMRKDAFVDYVNQLISQSSFGNTHTAWDVIAKMLAVPFQDPAREARRQIILQEIVAPKTESLI